MAMEANLNLQLESRGFLLRQAGVEDDRLEEFMAAINRLSIIPLQAEQVYIRSMYLCSDRLCLQDWGRFSPSALEQICKLVIGQSVIAGHDRSRLPIARFFHADVIEREDDRMDEEGNPVHWVRAWFYWLRGTSGSKDLQLNIDGGIYREVSISWRYRKAVCSICGDAIQQCPHVPGREYAGERCTFTINEVAEVLEGSIVYKGAEPGTRLEGGERIAAGKVSATDRNDASGGEGSAWLDLDRYRDIFNRQSRQIRSISIIAGDPERTRGLAWLANLAGLRTNLLPMNPGAGRSTESIEPADLIWVDPGRPEKFDRERSFWRGLLRRARFCVWAGTAGARENEAGRRVVGGAIFGPAWQIRSEFWSARGERFFELIREEQ